MPRHLPPAHRAVLFDLDGTLLDTAPDLAFALNTVRSEQGLEPLPLALIRPQVSHGTRGLLRIGFGLDTAAAAASPLRSRLLDLYAEHLAHDTRPFPGIPYLLQALERAGLPWGVVTNKPRYLTCPLLEQLDLLQRTAVVISGDTLLHSKPHPAPLLLAADKLDVTPGQCVYIGDAERDIEAGNRASMDTLVALYGYLEDDASPERWGAGGLVDDPPGVLDWLYPDPSPIDLIQQTHGARPSRLSPCP